MIDAKTSIWLAAGLMAGFLHASLLWRQVHRFSAWSPLMGMLRLGLIAVLLVAAALSGKILAGAAGWAVGLTVLGTWFMTRRSGRTVSAANTPPRE
jgi:hypothetical protein